MLWSVKYIITAENKCRIVHFKMSHLLVEGVGAY